MVNFLFVLFYLNEQFLDKSPLLLCQSENLSGDSLTDSATLNNLIPTTPLCINCKDLQVFKGNHSQIFFK